VAAAAPLGEEARERERVRESKKGVVRDMQMSYDRLKHLISRIHMSQLM
jgi:hypothetical protein